MPPHHDPEPLAPEPLDAVLAEVATYSPEYSGGLSSHAPMAAEALDRFGRADALEAWWRWYRDRLTPYRVGSLPGFDAALAPLAGELESGDWQVVLSSRLSRLAAAIATAAGHGALRTAHAARALTRLDTPQRRLELAQALAYWESLAEFLPSIDSDGDRSIDEVLEEIRFVGDGDLRGMISDRVRAELSPQLVAAVATANFDASSEAGLEAVLDAACRALLAAPPSGMFALLHAVTTTESAIELQRWADPDASIELRRSTWITVAALWAARGTASLSQVTVAQLDEPVGALTDVVGRAAANGDEHAIKLSVALWSHARANPASAATPLWAAAADAGVRSLIGT